MENQSSQSKKSQFNFCSEQGETNEGSGVFSPPKKVVTWEVVLQECETFGQEKSSANV